MVQQPFRARSAVLWCAAIVVLSALAFFLPEHRSELITRMLIMALFATSINIQVGSAGMMPLGQAQFFGLGAYAFSLLCLKGGLSLPLGFFGGLAISVVVIAIIGYLCLRGDSLTFALLHLAFNILLVTVAEKWIYFTGGDQGLTGVPRPGVFSGPFGFYCFVLLVVLVCYLVIAMVLRSPFGKVTHGLRENEERIRFLGIDSKRFQFTLFVFSSLFTAVAGMLFAMLQRGVFDTYMGLILSAEGLMMCLIGGMSSFLGPSLGAAIVVIVSTIASTYINQWQGLLGLIIIVCVLGFRGGILGSGKDAVG
ncbi:MAG: branched-chain amino acid ABC transporter permease [Syntrophorhabdales bacterium]